MKPQERNVLLYKTRNLAPYKRKEMILDYIDKAKALCEQELIIDAMHNQTDSVTMGIGEKNAYEGAIRNLGGTIKIFERY